MKILSCGCCGGRAPGKQHWNHDTGFGLCPRCAVYLAARGKNDELKGYGTPGVHYAVRVTRATSLGSLVVWHTLADDGDYHGWHVGVLKEFDNGTAIVREDGKEVAVRAE